MCALNPKERHFLLKESTRGRNVTVVSRVRWSGAVRWRSWWTSWAWPRRRHVHSTYQRFPFWNVSLQAQNWKWNVSLRISFAIFTSSKHPQVSLRKLECPRVCWGKGAGLPLSVIAWIIWQSFCFTGLESGRAFWVTTHGSLRRYSVVQSEQSQRSFLFFSSFFCLYSPALPCGDWLRMALLSIVGIHSVSG